MKKCISIMLLLAMMLSLAVAGTVGTSAATAWDNAGRTAAYATLKPKIDGVKDPIYDTTDSFRASGSGKWADVYVLWDGDGLYIFGETNSTSLAFYISGLACGMPDLGWNWSNGKYPGNYVFDCPQGGGDLIAAPYLGSYGAVAPEGMLRGTVQKDTGGFCVELFVPMAENCWYPTWNEPRIGFGVMAGRDCWAVSGWTGFDGIKQPYEMKSIILQRSNTGLPQKQGKTISMHGVQTTVADNDGEFDARFVAEIDSLDYDNAGFELSFTYDGKDYTKQLDTTTAYTSLLADNETVKPTKTADGNYLVALVLGDIPEAANLEVNVTPYTVSDGETSYGNAVTLTLNPTTNA